ncbi:MAG TPA: type I methionyl aminopeptidase [Clostridiaceae bacterium]|jgi:methionyl aminopeptidase|nr:type I methionyl aminopeptidase [Clostridiaceae bacterium]
MVRLKSESDLKAMREAGRVVAEVFAALEGEIRPGVSTASLERLAASVIRKAGASASFKGYGYPPFPGAICVSINEEVVHGIPSDDRLLEAGQIVSVDVGAKLNGFHGDAARTFLVGDVSEEVRTLVEVTKQSFFKALDFVRIGNRLGDISAAIQDYCEAHGYGVVRELTGHGIGSDLHEDPSIPNYGVAGRGIRLQEGMTLAIEPMITLGGHAVMQQSDGWTIVTRDKKPSAHYENTVAVTKNGPVILTAL